MADESSRRALLAGLGAAGVAGLAGCSGLFGSPASDDDGSSPNGSVSPSAATGPPPTATEPGSRTNHDAESPVATDSTTPAGLPEEGWPMVRHGPGNNAVHPSAPGPGGDLSVSWTAPFDENVDDESGIYVRSSPLVLDDAVVAVADSIRQSAPGTIAVAVDVETGESLWRNRYDYAPADDGLTATPSGTLGSDGRTLFLATKTDGWHLRGLDPSDGSELWERSLDHPLFTSGIAVPGAVYFGEWPHAAFDASDGTLVERYRDEDLPEDDDWTETLFEFPPSIADDTLYVPGPELEAIDRETDDVSWSAGTDFYSTLLDGPAWVNSPVVRDGVAYATTGLQFSAGGGIVAVSTDDGTVLWSAVPGVDGVAGTADGGDAGTGTGTGSPNGAEGDGGLPEHGTLHGMALVLDDVVVASGAKTDGKDDPRLVPGTFAYDRADGSPLWENGEYASSNLVAADGVVYMGGDPVVALDAMTGDHLGSAAMDDWGTADPLPLAIAGDSLFACHSTGIVAFGPE